MKKSFFYTIFRRIMIFIDIFSIILLINFKSKEIEESSITISDVLMTVALSIPKVWELLNRFKERCRVKGWKTSEHEDWVKMDKEYHNFLWIRTVHPSTFEKVALNPKCAIREGISYHVVAISYTAWVFSQTPPDNLIEAVVNDAELCKKTAIYDLSCAYAGKPLCSKWNETDSEVFKEFEKFLEEKWGVKFRLTHSSRLVSSFL